MRRSHALITVALGSLALSARPLRAFAQGSLEKLQVTGTPTEDMTNLYYGMKSGLFAKAGLDVELVPLGSGAVVTQAVITGTYPLGKTSTLVVFAAHLKGIPIVITTPELVNEPQHPFAMLQVAPDSTIKTAANLNGKTIACTALNDLNTLATRAWVDKNGGNWKSLKFVEIPNSITEQAIASHRVDAGILQNPQLDTSVAAGTTKSIGDAWSAITPNFMVGVYISRPDWVAKNADTLRRFNQAYIEATKYVNGHWPETISYASELTKIEPNKIAKMHRSLNGTVLNAATLQPIIDAGVKYGTLEKGFPAKDILWNG